MASSRAGEVALKVGSSPKCKWIFSKEEMMNMASLREGLDEFKELQLRQQSTKFIQLLGDRLNQHLKDNRGKITQLCMCAAMIHMHRFFYFHSFTFFDYRDVAAACLFLSGKSEECPRKIDHIVRAWWAEKFPGIKLDQQKYEDAMGLLVAIESIILQTIAFDLQVSLPHPLVLKAMHLIAKNQRKITEVVYFFSTDVLCVTSWGIRYSAEAIAVACVHIVCTWANFEIPSQSSDGSKWYHATDPTMTEDQLQEMMREFITVYKTCKNDLAITKFIKKGEIRDPISDGEGRATATPPALMDADLSRLPPPPPPPLSLMAKKVDIHSYKERRAAGDGSASSSSSTTSLHQSSSYGGSAAAGGGGGGSAHHNQQQQRRSFMPEMTQVKGVTASMPGFVPPKQEIKQEIKQEPSEQRRDWIKQEPVDRKDFPREDSYRSSSSSSVQRPSRPPSNGSSSGLQPSQHRSSSSSQHPSYMQQQQPSGSSDHHRSSMGGGDRERERGRDGGERERNEKRKREMSSSNLSSDKRSRNDMSMPGSGGSSQRGQPMMQQQPSSQSQQQLQHGQYNSVPPPLMQQPYSNSGKHYGGHSMSNGHHQQQPVQLQQQHRSSYGGYQQPPPQGMTQAPYHGGHNQMQNGYHMGSAVPPPPPPPAFATGNDMEDGEVF